MDEILNGYGIQLFQGNVQMILFAGVSVGIWWLATRKPKGIPPGPRFTLPIIGDALFLTKPGDDGDVRLPIRRLRKKYGDIFSFYIGSKLIIYVNGYKMIKEAFIKQSEVFGHRPSVFIFDTLAERKGILASSGNCNKEQRRAFIETLRGIGKAVLEDRIHEEINFLLEKIHAFEGRQVDLEQVFQLSVANTLATIIFGKRFNYEDPIFILFLERLNENFKLLPISALIHYIPSLKYFPGDMFNIHQVIDSVKNIESTVIHPSIEDHIKNYDENNIDDYISGYIKQMKNMEETGQETTLNVENLTKSILDLFVAGTDTTSSTLGWIFLFFLHYPKVYERCCKEIEDVVGHGRHPIMKDLRFMPYTEAVYMETLRLCNITLNGSPHAVSKDTMLNGYLIPKDAIVIPNLDSVLGDDEDLWGDVKAFRPERFLDSNGKILKYEEFIPFSIGRRVCVGESFARMNLFLILTRIIQIFDVQPDEPGILPTLNGVIGLTHCPTNYKVRLIAR